MPPHPSGSHAARLLRNDVDGDIILASSEEEAAAIAREELDAEDVIHLGWMAETGWDMDTYESCEEFERESGYESWWAGCQGPADNQERPTLRRAWSPVWLPESEVSRR